MKETYIKLINRPKLEKPMVIVGLPGIGNIGKIVAELLIEFSHADLFAVLYSPYFPDFVIIDKNGICRPPRYEFYASTSSNLIILTGDAQPQLEAIPAHYEVCGKILDLIGELGGSFIITLEGIPSEQARNEIYIAATSKKTYKEYTEKGAVIYKGDRIVAGSGIILGLAKMAGIEGVCLFGSTTDIVQGQEAAFNILRFLRKILGSTIKEGF